MSTNKWLISQELVDLIKQKESRQVFLLGNSDSGKTTFLATLAEQLGEPEGLAVVDLDAGQSRIGPPTTLAWGFSPAKFSWQDIKTKNLYFTGTTTAVGNLVPTIVGSVLICQSARAKAKKVFIDTCGLVAAGPGVALKTAQIQLIMPEVVIALEHSSELNFILEPFLANPNIKIVRLKVPSAMGAKTVAQRTAYREEQFRFYFSHARPTEIFWDKLSLYSLDYGVNIKFKLKEKDKNFFVGQLVSCRHFSGLDLALAVILDVDFVNQKFTLVTPLTEMQKHQVAAVVFSHMKVNPKTGEHQRSTNLTKGVQS